MKREVIPLKGQELTEILFVPRVANGDRIPDRSRSQGDTPNARLLDSRSPAPKRAHTPDKPNSKYRDVLKHIGLQLPDWTVGRIFSWRSPKEHPKVAIYQSRRMSVSNSLFHLIPLSATLVLLVLFWTRHWVGRDNGTSLQLAAKLHELLMQASLIDVLIHIIRVQAISGYLPLGALSGAVKAAQLSYLWSLDFLSAILSPNFSLRRKMAFNASVSGILLMTAIAGPSSAVLMIPRPGMSHTVDTVTRYVNVTESSLFPDQINNKSGMIRPGMLNVTRRDELIHMNVLESRRTADGHVLAEFPSRGTGEERIVGTYGVLDHYRVASKIYLARQDGRPSTSIHGGIATIPTMLSARRLFRNSPMGHYGNNSLVRKTKSDNTRWTTYTSHPVVGARCSESQPDKVFYYIRDDDSQSPLPDAAGLIQALGSKYTNETGSSIQPPGMLWTSSPDGPNSLLAIAFGRGNLSVLVCTVNSFWHRTLTTMVPIDTGYTVQSSLPDSLQAIPKSHMTGIVLDAGFMMSLGSPCENYYDDGSDLAMCLVIALSWFPGFHQPYTRYDANSYEGYELSDLKDSTTLNKFEITETIDGYGYGATGTSIRLSVAVMIAYCTITVTYICYIIITGHTSIAWDSATELLMLALQSKEPAGLGHISVGLDSMETFRKGVGIRVSSVKNEGTGQAIERLELVFENDKEGERRELTKIERGKAY